MYCFLAFGAFNFISNASCLPDIYQWHLISWTEELEKFHKDIINIYFSINMNLTYSTYNLKLWWNSLELLRTQTQSFEATSDHILSAWQPSQPFMAVCSISQFTMFLLETGIYFWFPAKKCPLQTMNLLHNHRVHLITILFPLWLPWSLNNHCK